MKIRTKPVLKLSKNREKKFKKYKKLLDIIFKRELEKVDAILVTVTGIRGTGKSVTGIDMARKIDPHFTAEQVCFERAEVDLALDKLAWTGDYRAIVYDETGASLGARRWHEFEQIKLIEKFQIVRDTGVSIICCLPHLRFGDSSLDLIANFGLEMVKPKHKKDCYRLAKVLKTSGIYSRRKAIEFQPIWLKGKIFHAPFLSPHKEVPDLYEAYLLRKRLYIKKRQERDREELHVDVTPKQLKYLRLFVQGLSNTQVALKMKVSRGHAKDTRRLLREKGLLAKVKQ